MNQNKQTTNRNRSHYLLLKDSEPYIQRRHRRGNVAKVAIAGASVVAGLGATVHSAAEHSSQYDVDIEKVESLSEEERTANYDAVTVAPGDTLGVIADRYLTDHGIEGSRTDLVDSMHNQALAHDGDETIHPGEVFYIPRQNG